MTLSTPASMTFKTQSVAELTNDCVVNDSDLNTLLLQWGTCLPAGSCTADFDIDGDVDAADMAFLLANWQGGGGGAVMTQPGDMAFGDTNIFKDGAGANQPNQNVTTLVPWVIAAFGFDSIASYTSWLELLTEAETFAHIEAMLDLITAP